MWPKVKAAVNLALHKDLSEVVMKNERIWIRLGDDISISIYAPSVEAHPSPMPKRNPFHPGCLEQHVRIPIEWWNDNIEDTSDELKKEADWLTRLNS